MKNAQTGNPEVPLSNFCSLYFSRLRSWRALAKSTLFGKLASAKSSSTAIAKSKSSAKRPSAYLRLSCLALVVAAGLAIFREEEGEDARLPPLKAKGWQRVEAPACPGLTPGFYEIESELESQEFFYLGSDQAWRKEGEAPWPEAPFSCHPIPQPAFVEEIP